MKEDNFKESLLAAEFPAIIGQERVKESLQSALLAGRNVVIVGPPGVGKTTLARDVAALLPAIEVATCGFNCLPGKPACPSCMAGKTTGTKNVSGAERFVRVQGSPDLTAEDLLGDIDPLKALEYGPLSVEAFTPGKIFRAHNGIFFFDEVNRCSEKLQNALLQVLEERKVTLGGYDVEFESDFFFIGTMNPEDSSTEKLSDVFLDRFDLVTMGYPETAEREGAIVEAKARLVPEVDFPKGLRAGVIGFIRSLRDDENVEKRPSVRASIGVVERAAALALVRRRKRVTLAEVKDVIVSVLEHRVVLKPSVKYMERVDEYVQQRFSSFAEEQGFGGAG